METESEGRPHDYSLYLAADQKIDKLKEQVSELYQKDNANKERIAHLNERLEMGLAATSRQHGVKLTEFAVQINNLEHFRTSSDEKLKHLERILGRIMTGLFWVSFTGVLGGLVAMAYQILKVRLVGG